MSDYLIAYDIAAPKRLQKIYKRLCEEAIPFKTAHSSTVQAQANSNTSGKN